MNRSVITAVGIDVSKGKSMVAVRRPGGEIVLMPFQVQHNAGDLKSLAATLKRIGGDIRIVMEHTGMYWRPIALTLQQAGFYVSIVNAMLIHNFSDNSLRKVKTDKVDALKIANYALTFWSDLREYTPEDETRQMPKMQTRLYERTQATSVTLKNGLISLLDQTFPGINTLFSSNARTTKGHFKWVDFVRKFWHKDCVAKLSRQNFTETYLKWCRKTGYTDLMTTPAVLRKGHKDTGKTVGPSVIEKLNRTMKAAFNYAVKQGYILYNPVLAATIPEYEKSEVVVWEPEEAKRALDTCQDKTLKACMLLAIGGSLRIGEILGLQWDSVNVSEETIADKSSTVHIHQEQKRCEKAALAALDAVGRSKVYFTFPEQKADCKTTLVLKAPKTASSVRTVYISKTVGEALLELKAEQEHQKEALHGLYEDFGMVIALSNGRPMERRLIDKAFKAHIAAQGLTPIVFHSLRHFSTSMKLSLCGDIKAVQGDTGHATADMVTGVYGHAFRSNRQQLAEDMEEHFFHPDKSSAESSEKLARLAAILGEKPELLDLLLAVAG